MAARLDDRPVVVQVAGLDDAVAAGAPIILLQRSVRMTVGSNGLELRVQRMKHKALLLAVAIVPAN